MAAKTWLVTGASSGLGATIAEVALKAGHKVIATARNPTKAAVENPQIEQLGGTWIRLDVTERETTKKVKDAIDQAGGQIDIVVNNAGYSLLGSIEDMSEEEISTQFSTNVYGPVRVLKGALPFMRAARSGTIVNISSSAGLDGLPTCAMYAGTKFAMEGMSESLSKELEPFGIRVLIVEPGALRTQFWSSFVEPAAGMNQDYAGTPLENVLDLFRSGHGNQPGDPFKVAQRIVEAVTGTGVSAGKGDFLRLPLGPDCYKRFQTKIQSMQENLLQLKDIAHSTSYEQMDTPNLS
ncbi:short-chain dehydrogenase/reductase SDR [Penicillium verhagenii]|uniref:short-chain dehydrogenase/reductase SDR n=1 Tax=Penicillium verhagenii TaxID=1562060 RepID=UPI0025459AD3|nr:short-chain dehydrogenase/reductase SDR [Penicillium verhagenii]KAJ5917157.1 short-chain dehydrogenase/reductase SDR [Penicillium verhagenii]